MPEDMSDRMPEDLPVTKRIDVMVGITRSKVFFSTEFFSTESFFLPKGRKLMDPGYCSFLSACVIFSTPLS
jgi:hypothetical protein